MTLTLFSVPNVRFLVVVLAEMVCVWRYLLARILANTFAANMHLKVVLRIC